jgi:hypothetical protein
MKGRRAAMRTKLEYCGALIVFVLLVVGSDSSFAGERRAMTRSLYLPVAFQTCEYLTGATLYMGDQAVGTLPTERTFLFTYYPKLKRLEPAFTELRIEGALSEDGSPFVGRLAIGPGAISSAEKRIDLDFESVKQQLSYRIDVRYEKVRVTICPPAREPDDVQDGTETASLETSPPLELPDEP